MGSEKDQLEAGTITIMVAVSPATNASPGPAYDKILTITKRPGSSSPAVCLERCGEIAVQGDSSLAYNSSDNHVNGYFGGRGVRLFCKERRVDVVLCSLNAAGSPCGPSPNS
jgi:hypothetical protein